MAMKIGLGTVQFGLDYGITNREGKTPQPEVSEILKMAAQHGVIVLDTAYSYGDSEKVLGSILSAMDHAFQIVTKTPHFVSANVNGSKLMETFYESLERLNQKNVYGLLFHRAADLLGPAGKELYKAAICLKERGLIKKIGVSVYDVDEINQIINCFPVDIVQLPLNIYDQRFLSSGQLFMLKKLGVEVHARSAFLQGLLLADTIELPSYFAKIIHHHACYLNFLKKHCLSPLAAALGFVQGIKEVDAVICGVNNSRQLSEILRYANVTLPTQMFAGFSIDDEDMVNPTKWGV